jgi:hypothetical protein
MVSALSRLGNDELDPNDAARPRTRKVSRRNVNASALVASMHGDRTEAAVGDISTHGCSIQTDADWLRMGMFVSIQLGQEEALHAIVRWVRGGAGGVEFLRPITSDRLEWHARMDDDSIW